MTELSRSSRDLGADNADKRQDHTHKSSPEKKATNGSIGQHEANGGAASKSSGKKRRKVNHACVYCRRSHMTCDLERPCTRCIKRNIGHLCHDEPREPAKKSKSELTATSGNESPVHRDSIGVDSSDPAPEPAFNSGVKDTNLGLDQLSQKRRTTSLVQPTPVIAPQASSMAANNQLLGFQDWNFGSQNNGLHDMHNFHPQYSFGTSEVSNEFNLLNDFLTHSMIEDASMFPNDDAGNLFQSDTTLSNTMHTLNNSNMFLSVPPQSQTNEMPPPSQAALGNAISRPASGFPIDKARETFYLTAADPAGNDTAERRMQKLLQAKYKAGLLKPFNYVKGYSQLKDYMERNLQQHSRLRIIKQLDSFRPYFRTIMQPLSDVQLVGVEMEFEKKLMEYDRVFASMAIPACCWRRTGEIYRGNKEMATLLGVPIEKLRDGRIAIHEIFTENTLVSYWEKFGAIAFDDKQKAILTSCTLRASDSQLQEPEIRCCFSFTVRRDGYNVPSLIIGHFLPILPHEK